MWGRFLQHMKEKFPILANHLKYAFTSKFRAKCTQQSDSPQSIISNVKRVRRIPGYNGSQKNAEACDRSDDQRPR